MLSTVASDNLKAGYLRTNISATQNKEQRAPRQESTES